MGGPGPTSRDWGGLSTWAVGLQATLPGVSTWRHLGGTAGGRRGPRPRPRACWGWAPRKGPLACHWGLCWALGSCPLPSGPQSAERWTPGPGAQGVTGHSVSLCLGRPPGTGTKVRNGPVGVGMGWSEAGGRGHSARCGETGWGLVRKTPLSPPSGLPREEPPRLPAPNPRAEASPRTQALRSALARRGARSAEGLHLCHSPHRGGSLCSGRSVPRLRPRPAQGKAGGGIRTRIGGWGCPGGGGATAQIAVPEQALRLPWARRPGTGWARGDRSLGPGLWRRGLQHHQPRVLHATRKAHKA